MEVPQESTNGSLKRRISATQPAISRSTLALFAGASFDHNPIHIDTDFAQAAGRDDVFAHGMLCMAYAAHALCQNFSIASIKSISVRFSAITNLHDEITCSADLVEITKSEDGPIGKYAIMARCQAGQTKLTGEAVIALPEP